LPKAEAGGKNHRGHMADIPRIISFAQQRDWAKEPFMDGHYLIQLKA
jgi:hypothetical protein